LLLRERQLLTLVLPIARPTLWAWIARGAFPRPIRLSRGAVAWRREDVLDWIASRKTTTPTDFLLTDEQFAAAGEAA
jgi:prophage regulatory protein